MDKGDKPKIIEQEKPPKTTDPEIEAARQAELERIKRMRGKRSTMVSGSYSTGGGSLKKTLGGS